MKLCKDCKWCEGDDVFAKCTAPAGRKKIVKRTGFEAQSKYAKWKYCDMNRAEIFPFNYIFGSCGILARWWEPK